MQSRMNIVLTANDSYMEHTAVTMISILENSNPEDSFKFYILSNDISEKSQKRVLKMKKVKNFDIEFVKIETKDFEGSPLSRHLTEQVYYRIKMPVLINETKVLYLDSDLIVKKSLKNLYAMNLTDKTITVIEDLLVKKSISHSKQKEILDCKNYFNSGVMLWNLDLARADNVSEKCFDFIRSDADKLTYCDQDTLNYVLKDSSIYADEIYNFQYNPYYKNIDKIYSSQKEKIVVLHFVSDKKPWNLQPRLDFAFEYYKYALKTPWRYDAMEHLSYIVSKKFKNKITFTLKYLFEVC